MEVVSIFCPILVTTFDSKFPIPVGDLCILHTKDSGVCTLISECHWLRENIKSRSMTLNDIVLCGFEVSTALHVQWIDNVLSIHLFAGK